MFEFESKRVESASGEQRLELVISKDVNIENIARLKEILLTALSDNQHVVMDMSGVTKLDFSVMQLLCAANKYAQRHKKSFRLKNQCTTQFIDRAQSLGLLREQACNEAEDPTQCLWIAENLS